MKSSKGNCIEFSFQNVLLGKNPLPSAKRNSYLLMHPSAIKDLELCKRSCVLLYTNNGQLLFRCWPCFSLEKNALMLPALNFFHTYTKGPVFCRKYPLLVGSAAFITLECDHTKSYMKTACFKSFIKKQLENVYLKEGLEFNISFLGDPCRFSVVKIVSEDADQITHQENLVDICEDISSLNICDSNLDCSIDETAFICSTPVSSKQSSIHTNLFNKTREHESSNLNKRFLKPEHFFFVDSETKIMFQNLGKEKISPSVQLTFHDLCGLETQVNEMKLLLQSLLNQESVFKEQSYGIILVGASGTGKRSLVYAVGNEFQLPVFKLKCVSSERYDEEYKQELKMMYDEVVNNSPSILFLDGIDGLPKKNDRVHPSGESKLVHLLSNMIHDLLRSGNNVLIIGTAYNLSAVEDSLRKPGALEKEISFGIPSSNIRKEILGKILSTKCHKVTESQIKEISDITHGFTGGDLKLLCDKADFLSYERKYEKDSCITFEDLKETLKNVKPSSMSEFVLEVPKVKWSDIGGMHAVKRAITELVDWPLNHAEQFKNFGLTASRGILMYGPPGCSKTMIAKALVSESHLNFISIKGPQLFNKYVGESEKAVSELFKKARSAAPCVLFFDEIDSLVLIRGSTSGNSNVAERILTQLLIEVDGIDVLQGVSIIAATNRPDMIDPSFLRPGRFDQMIYVPLPDSTTRKEIFEAKLKNMFHSPDVNIFDLVVATNGYTGAEITEVCREAAMFAIEDYIKSGASEINMHPINMHHFLSALKSVVPRTSKETIQFYENYNKMRS